MSLLRSFGVASALAAFALIAGAPAATAQCPQAPVSPGNSEVDQYQETIPGACGDQKPGGDESGSGSGGGSGDGGGSVTPDTASDLDSLGSDGAAVAGLAAATGPGVAAADGGKGDGGDGSFSAGTVAAGSSSSGDGSAIEALTRGLGGDSGGGIGILLPVLLIGTVIAVIAGVAIRSRTSV